MTYGLYFFAVYFVIGFMLAFVLGRFSGNYRTAMVFFWPIIVYLGIRLNVATDRIGRLPPNDTEGFCRLMKISKIEFTRNEINGSFIYTFTFQNGQTKRYTVHDYEIENMVSNRNTTTRNHMFYILASKIIYGKNTG